LPTKDKHLLLPTFMNYDRKKVL